MAQQIITLATEETSQDILTRVKGLELKVLDIHNEVPAIKKIGGGINILR